MGLSWGGAIRVTSWSSINCVPPMQEGRRRQCSFRKSLEWPELTVQVVGNNAVVRHLWVSESELDGKVTNTKIGVMQVWQKQDGSWKLLARASWRLPPA